MQEGDPPDPGAPVFYQSDRLQHPYLVWTKFMRDHCGDTHAEWVNTLLATVAENEDDGFVMGEDLKSYYKSGRFFPLDRVRGGTTRAGPTAANACR